MLTEIVGGVWEATQPLKVAGFELGHRMTVLRLDSGELALHSPIALSSAVQRDVQALGKVVSILAPSFMHDLYLAEWMKAFPEAVLHHSPVLSLKGLNVARATSLDREVPKGLVAIPIEGMPTIQEFAIFHPGTRTLVVCDLVFNLPPGRGLQKLLQKANGIYERLGPSRLFKSTIRHDEAFRTSIQELLKLDFDRLIVGHGSNVNNNAREHLRHAFEWLRLT
jgi:hypothetical protein